MPFDSKSLYPFLRAISPDEMALRRYLQRQYLPVEASQPLSSLDLDAWDPFPEAKSSSKRKAEKMTHSIASFGPYPPSLAYAMLTKFGRNNEPFVGRYRVLSYDISGPYIDTKYLWTGVREDQDASESSVDSVADGEPADLDNAQQEHSEEDFASGTLPCRWSKVFGGHCRATFENRQQHDRHVLSHIPDVGGVLWTTYKCRLCLEHRDEVIQNAMVTGRVGKQDVGLFARKDPCVRHIRNLHFDGNGNNDAQNLIEDNDPWWWPSALFYTSTYRKPRESLKPRPGGENRTWMEYLNDILLEHPFARNKPIEPVEALRRDLGLIDEEPPADRPTKRRRVEK